MVRSPCCEKMGLKKGPWTPEEDQILISYINQYGHENWRALPKQAGLSRCGKSCRLRWTNYLRPDIKRGNFSQEEEETIIKLHQVLGNRWSAIAMRLPGRTDNEIKNFWHTRLKKKLINRSPDGMVGTSPAANCDTTTSRPVMLTCSAYHQHQHQHHHHHHHHHLIMRSESICSSSSTNHTIGVEASSPTLDPGKQPPMTPPALHFSDPAQLTVLDVHNSTTSVTKNDGMDFWYNLFIGAGDLHK